MIWHGCEPAILGLAVFLLLALEVEAQNPQEFAECLGNSEFILVDEIVSFDTAVTRCHERAGDLAVPCSDAEHALFVSLVLGSNVPSNAAHYVGRLLSNP